MAEYSTFFNFPLKDGHVGKTGQAHPCKYGGEQPFLHIAFY